MAAKPLNETQILFLLRVLHGRIVWRASLDGRPGYMIDPNHKFYAATMDFLLRKKWIVLPSRTERDRRIQLTEGGKLFAEGLASSWKSINATAQL